MESAIQVMKSTPILQNIPERTQVVSPTRLHVAKLPPIASLSSDEHPSSAYLQAASSELKDAMKHLLSEVSHIPDCMVPGYKLIHDLTCCKPGCPFQNRPTRR